MKEFESKFPPNKGISIITSTNRPGFIKNVFANYLRQEYPFKELIIVLNNNLMNLDEWRNMAKSYHNIRVFQVDEKVSLGECYNQAIKGVHYNYVAKFDDDDYYAPLYLAEAMHTFSDTEAHIVGKACRFIYFEAFKMLGLSPVTKFEFSYVDFVVGATLVIKKGVFDLVKFPNITSGEDTVFEKLCLGKGFKIYSSGRSNYVTIRRASKPDHTFIIDHLTYLKTCQCLFRTDDYKYLITDNNYQLF